MHCDLHMSDDGLNWFNHTRPCSQAPINKLAVPLLQKQVAANDDSDEEGYLRYLKERPPKKGWQTPTYEEILDKKRQEERNYR